ncbi:MAG: hypothetical protein M3Q95_11745 [Bacteroidota bacterium]|nr:hypothetical protein [Bacteroidota bacterium]
MKALYTWAALILLFFSSAGAYFAGYQLVDHSDGSTLKLPLELLEHTPFKNFFIPGILLFISVGITGSLALIVTFLQVRYHAKFVIASGLLLTCWILVKLALTTEIQDVDYLILATGLAEMLCGLALDRKK